MADNSTQQDVTESDDQAHEVASCASLVGDLCARPGMIPIVNSGDATPDYFTKYYDKAHQLFSAGQLDECRMECERLGRDHAC